MTTDNEAKKERNYGIGYGSAMTMAIISIVVYGCIFKGTDLISIFFMLLCALLFFKVAYDAYTTPILYFRQRRSLLNTHKEQEAELRKVHKISKYSFWR